MPDGIAQDTEEIRRLRAIVAGRSFDGDPEDAAIRLAALAASGALEALFKVIARACGFESLPLPETVAAVARFGLPAAEEALRRLRHLDETEEEALAEDSGDVADEFWRLRTAYARILEAIGVAAVPALRDALGAPGERTREMASEALARLGLH